MGTARPKEYFMLQFSNWMGLIEFRPQHKFKVEIEKNGMYMVSRDNVSVKFDKADFEKHFKVVE